MAKVTPQEQNKFQIYTRSRILDFNSWKKSSSQKFRIFLKNQRQKSFPLANEIYYEDKVDRICETLSRISLSPDTVVIVDIEIFDQLCEKLQIQYE